MALKPPSKSGALKLPPNYGNVPSGALFTSELKREVCLTLARLHALAWQTKGDRTPPATVPELAEACGIGERQMWREIAILRKGGWIGWDALGDGRFVVRPLRLGAAALATDDEAQKPEATVTDDSKSTVTDDSKPQVLNGGRGVKSTVIYDSNWRFQAAPTVTDDSNGAKPASTVTDDSHVVLKHVVVESDSDLKTQQQHDNQDSSTVTDDSNPTDTDDNSLILEIAEAFMAEGVEETPAYRAAAKAVADFEPDDLRYHLQYYHRHCEIKRASAAGLRTAVGLFLTCVRDNWDPPEEPQKVEPQETEKSWYSDEEFKQLFQK